MYCNIVNVAYRENLKTCWIYVITLYQDIAQGRERGTPPKKPVEA